MNFRYDINGLRAIAVIAVVLFHFESNWVPGGFSGVDVFFVISGFLMTSIIFRGLENNNFSLLKFYASRANRIIPALVVLCLFLLIFGWLFLTPLDNRALEKHITSSVGFLSNIIYWRESGYFDIASHKKWLLHTWSLSVEWQFYIIYPIVLLGLRKLFPLVFIKRILILGAILGFAFSVYASFRWPNPAYYLLPTRAWEMMSGGIAFLYPLTLKERVKQVIEILGVIFILLSYAIISCDTIWPGYHCLLPVFGACLIIVSNRQSSVITNNVIFQYIGRWSYSIYLWHWPVVVFGYYYDITNWQILGITISISLGYCSYRLIETQNFSNLSTVSFKKALTFKPLWMVILVCMLSSYSYINIESKLGELPADFKMAQKKYGYCFTPSGSQSSEGDTNELGCFIHVGNKDHHVLAFGDSFMGHYEPLLRKFGIDNDLTIQSLTTGSCFPAFTESDHYPKGNERIAQCIMERKFAKSHLEQFDTIIISTRWDEYFVDHKDYSAETFDMIEEVLNLGKNVIFLPIPTVYNRNIGDEFKNTYIGDDEFKLPSYMIDHEKDNYNKIKSQELKHKFSDNEHFIFIDRELFYPSETFVFKNKLMPYSYDDGHISILANEIIWNNIQKNGLYNTKIKPYL